MSVRLLAFSDRAEKRYGAGPHKNPGPGRKQKRLPEVVRALELRIILINPDHGLHPAVRQLRKRPQRASGVKIFDLNTVDRHCMAQYSATAHVCPDACFGLIRL